MRSKFLHWFAILLILQIGLLHLMTAQGEYEEAAYLGYLFMGNFLATLLGAYGIYRKKLWGWMLGLFVAIASIAGYTWSRTLGMPGMEVEEWFIPYGIVAMTVEGIFVLLFILRPWKIPADDMLPSAAKNPFRYVQPAAGLFILGLISVFAYRWDLGMPQEAGQHVGSLEQVSTTLMTSFPELEQRYGMQVALVATSMMDSIVDVRLKVVDPEKAKALLMNQAALLVDQQVLVLAPHMHHHGDTKRDKIHVMFFPTQNNTIHTGSEVSLVFGPVRVESVTVR